jgi:phytol kinase
VSAGAGIALVLGALGVLMLAVKGLQGSGRVGPELSRKLVHMGMGACCLGFPWLFAATWPAWLLAGLAVIALGAVRLVPPLRDRFGAVLGGVDRASWGELYFPVGVAIVFTLAGREPRFFCIPVAILAFADAAGALVGKRWGRNRYEAVESTKSVEGSAAVLLVTWGCVTGGLAVFTDLAWPDRWLAGLGLGLFAMLVEAVSWRGLDNLLLPLAAFAQLKVIARLEPADLATRAVLLIALTLFMLAWRRRSLLDDSARLGAALAAYLFWSVGGWQWLVAPAVLMASYTRLMPTIPGGPPRHNLAAIVCIASAGLPWMLAQSLVPDPRWLWLFTLGLAAQQAIIAAVRFSQGRPQWRPWQWWLVAVTQAVALQGGVFLAVNGPAYVPPASLLIGAASLAAALALFMTWDPRLRLPDDLNARWWRQGLTAGLASVAGYVVMQA